MCVCVCVCVCGRASGVLIVTMERGVTEQSLNSGQDY